MKIIIKRIAVLAFLVMLLFVSYIEFEIPTLSVYATKTDASSTNSNKPTDHSSKKTSGSSSSDVALLARVINAEARGEPYTGQVAVGAVVLNRVRSSSFPNTIAGVIYQPGAFTAVNDGQINKPVTQSSYNAARDAMNGWDPSGGALYYYNPATATSDWIWSRPVITQIGNHRFCK